MESYPSPQAIFRTYMRPIQSVSRGEIRAVTQKLDTNTMTTTDPWTPSAKHAEEAHYDVAANAPVSELSGRGSNDSILGDDLHADITSSTHIASDQSSWHCRERCYSTQSNQVYAGLAGLAANEYGQVFYGGWLVANVDRAYTEHIAGCTIGEDGSVLEPNGRVAHAAVISIRDRYAVARRKAFLPLEGLPVLLDGSVRDANDVILGMLAEDSARELQGLRVEELGGLIDRGANLTGRVELYRSVEGSKPADHELEE